MPFVILDNLQGRGQRAINIDRIEYADYEPSNGNAPDYPKLAVKLVGVQGVHYLHGEQAETAWNTITGMTPLINVLPEAG